MNGGINATRGYLYQYLICILDSFKDDWLKVVIEPHTDREKVDILWFYPSKEDLKKDYKKAVQVKSSQNQFGKPEVRRLAEDLKEKFKDADEYEIILIGHASSTLLKYLQHGKVKIPAPKIFDLETFTGLLCHKLDKYIYENYAVQIPWYLRETLVFSLVGKLQYYSTNKREVTRAEFEGELQSWIRFYTSFDDYEREDSQKFFRDYKFESTPDLRIAIKKFYNRSRKVKKFFFKECQNFLTADREKNLKVIYPKSDTMSCYLFSGLTGLVFLFIVIFLLFGVYIHPVFLIVCLLLLPLYVSTIKSARPYFLAKIIENELKELDRRQ